MQTVHLLLVSGVLAWALRRAIVVLQALRANNGQPGPRRLLSLSSVLGGLLMPRIPGVSAGKNYFLRAKHQPYIKYGWDGYVEISIFGNTASVVLADPAAIKEVATLPSRFPKPTEIYKSLAIYGDNIVNVEGEKWRKFKKLTAPAFAERNNKLVWVETMRIVSELCEDVWGDKEVIQIDHCLDLTLPIALHVLSAAVFGNRESWEEGSKNPPPGHKLTFKEAIHIATGELIIKSAIPNWALGLTERTRRMRQGFEELGVYMNELLEERRATAVDSHNDLFSLLMSSKEGTECLEDIEITGNTFIFLVAGHETTAHALCFAFGMLALYQDIQEKLYQHITSVLSDGRLPTYDDLPKLTYSLAVFYETVRMFPAVPALFKGAAEDTTLDVGNQKGERKTIVIPKGTPVAMDLAGVHYNPRYWSDPHTFKPERFLDASWPRDAFFGFSTGPRACLGKKFAENEAVAVLTTILLKYKVTVKEEPQFANETFEERKERVLASEVMTTVTPVRVPLTFTRRK